MSSSRSIYNTSQSFPQSSSRRSARIHDLTNRINTNKEIEIVACEPQPQACYYVEICGFSSTSPTELKKHAQTHRIQATVCSVCGVTANSLFELAEHRKQTHGLSSNLSSSVSSAAPSPSGHIPLPLSSDEFNSVYYSGDAERFGAQANAPVSILEAPTTSYNVHLNNNQCLSSPGNTNFQSTRPPFLAGPSDYLPPTNPYNASGSSRFINQSVFTESPINETAEQILARHLIWLPRTPPFPVKKWACDQFIGPYATPSDMAHFCNENLIGMPENTREIQRALLASGPAPQIPLTIFRPKNSLSLRVLEELIPILGALPETVVKFIQELILNPQDWITPMDPDVYLMESLDAFTYASNVQPSVSALDPDPR